MAKAFKKEDLQELVGGGEVEGLEIIMDRITGNTRWSIHYHLVFKETSTGEFYHTIYSKGATEQQDEGPFEDEDDVIMCNQVYPTEMVVTVYIET